MRTALLMIGMCGIAALLVTGQEPDALPLPGSGNVTLPLDEYNKLVELAGRPLKKPDTPPVLYAIRWAGLKLDVTGNIAKGTVNLDGTVMGRGTIEVPLISGTTVLDIRQSGKDLALEQRNGVHTVVLNGPAEFEVTLDVALPLNVEAAKATMILPAPAAGAAELTLAVPGDRVDVHINPGLIVHRTSEGGHTTVEATLVPGQKSTIWWTTRETTPPPAPREIRFLSDVRTLVTVGEADLKVAALADFTVLQGQPSEFSVAVPAGFEVTSATGTALDSSEVQSGVLTLKLSNVAERSYQFLVTMERPLADDKADAPFLNFRGAQRETGEVLVEGAGTMELTAKESGGLRRMDLREADAYLRSLAHESPQAAFRFHRQPGEALALELAWVRFPATTLLAAVAERAQVTTMVTSEGRSLTEVKLDVRNQAQPFLKVALPAGAAVLSADVAGEKVKPVQGSDGSRVPLLRPGFHPRASYEVSFVFLHSGAPFAKKGEAELDLPRMDVPVALLQWEVFLPEQYRVRDFGGNAISTATLPPADRQMAEELNVPTAPGTPAAMPVVAGSLSLERMAAGDIGGVVIDPSGAVVPGASVTATLADGRTLETTSDARGRWRLPQVPPGKLKLAASASGFRASEYNVEHDARRAEHYSFSLEVGGTAESIAVTANPSSIQRESRRIERETRNIAQEQQNQASANVISLQRRVAGVLPIAIDVPRSGTSFQFVRPLVVDEETKVTFGYSTARK